MKETALTAFLLINSIDWFEVINLLSTIEILLKKWNQGEKMFNEARLFVILLFWCFMQTNLSIHQHLFLWHLFYLCVNLLSIDIHW